MTFAHSKALGAIVAALAVAWARPADAHIQLVYPAQRTAGQKTGPCGDGGGSRSDAVTVLPSGGKIVVEWDETVEHPGHFRVSFDDDGDDDFVDPESFTDTYTNDAVLVDDIEDQNASSSDLRYRQEIDLPDIECENCTLQLIQVMTDKGPTYGDNDLYYQCADVTLRRDAPGGAGGGGQGGGPGGGGGGGGGGNSNGPGGAAGAGQGGAGDGSASRGGATSGSGPGDASVDGDTSNGGCSYQGANGRGVAGALAVAAALAALSARRRLHRARARSAR